MSYVIPPSAGVREDQAKAIGEAVRLLHRAGWHDTAKRIADQARESGLCVDDGKRLVLAAPEGERRPPICEDCDQPFQKERWSDLTRCAPCFHIHRLEETIEKLEIAAVEREEAIGHYMGEIQRLRALALPRSPAPEK